MLISAGINSSFVCWRHADLRLLSPVGCLAAEGAGFEIRGWRCIIDTMQSNRLQLNTAKTEVLWCSSIRRQHQIPQPGLRVGADVIVPSDFVRDPTNASIDWRRATSSTNSSACRRLCRDGTFGRHRRPIMLCLAFSGRHSTVVHSLWQRLEHETANRHMSHHLHRWRHSNAASRLSCSWNCTFKPDIGWCSTSLLWLCYVPSKSTLIYVMLIIFVINKSLSTIFCHECEMNMLCQAESSSTHFWVSDIWNPRL